MSNLNFYFHESFPLQVIYLSEILQLASENYCGSKYDISNLTGIPTGDTSGKVEPHVKYLEFMGLINSQLTSGKYKLSLTKLGEIVYESDRYIMQDFTKKLMHYNITRKSKGAPQWSFLFRDYPYDFNTPISLNKIIENGKLIYGKEIYLKPVKTIYNTGDFSSISPIEFNDKDIIFKGCYASSDCNNLYAYTLLKELEESEGKENEVTLDKIFEDIKWQKGFGFEYDTALEVLDELNYMGIIKLNKQLNPITLIINKSSEDLILQLYDDLI